MIVFVVALCAVACGLRPGDAEGHQEPEGIIDRCAVHLHPASRPERRRPARLHARRPHGDRDGKENESENENESESESGNESASSTSSSSSSTTTTAAKSSDAVRTRPGTHKLKFQDQQYKNKRKGTTIAHHHMVHVLVPALAVDDVKPTADAPSSHSGPIRTRSSVRLRALACRAVILIKNAEIPSIRALPLVGRAYPPYIQQCARQS